MKGNRTEQITVRFSPEEKKYIEIYCAVKDIPVAQYIRALVLKEVNYANNSSKSVHIED